MSVPEAAWPGGQSRDVASIPSDFRLRICDSVLSYNQHKSQRCRSDDIASIFIRVYESIRDIPACLDLVRLSSACKCSQTLPQKGEIQRRLVKLDCFLGLAGSVAV